MSCKCKESEEAKFEASANRSARCVISSILSYLESGERVPTSMLLSVGGCLIDHVDAYGGEADGEIHRLYELCNQAIDRNVEDDFFAEEENGKDGSYT